MGYTTYIKPTTTELTLPEIIASLTGAQKLLILNGFADNKAPSTLKHEVPIKVVAIKEIYQNLERIKNDCNALMREEIVVEEEVSHIDPDTQEKVIDTPAVYNEQPVDLQDLKDTVAPIYVAVLNAAQVGAAIDKQIEYAEVNAAGNYIGTWDTYVQEVEK